MNNTDFVPLDTLREFEQDMARATEQLRKVALEAVVPSSSVLAQIAEQWLIPQSHLQKIFEQSAVIPSSRLEALAQEIVAPRILASQFWEEMKPVFQHTADLMGDLMSETKAGAERLAKAGWTLPVHMTAGEMLELLEETDNDKIDEDFMAFYHDGEALPLLKRALLGAARLRDWQPLLEQCFGNYEKGDYLICIPALLTVLEGGLALPEGASFVGVNERIAYFRDKIAASTPDSLHQVMWESINTFTAALYEKSDFGAGTRPSRLNRHWILHGRDLPSSWRQADALRLFHALSTLCTLCH